MGAAKLRKQQGTYFGQQGYIPVDRDLNRKSDRLKPADLSLLDVPSEQRESVREFLTLFLPKFKLAAGDCWRVAQDFMQTANSARVEYVEGVWTRAKNNEWVSDDGAPVPHAWNLVDGHLVDLVAEFYHWRSWGEDAPWNHEPFKIFTHEDIKKYQNEIDDLDGLSISVTILAYGLSAEFGMPEIPLPEGDDWEAFYMREASDRLQAKIAKAA